MTAESNSVVVDLGIRWYLFVRLLFVAMAAHAQTPDEGRGAVPEPGPSVRKKSRGLLIGGWASFGTLYLGNVAVAGLAALAAGSLPVIPAATSPLNALFIPLAGPFVALRDPRNRSAGAVVALMIDGLAQLAAMTLAIGGTVLETKEPHPDEPEFAWRLSPAAPGALLGATFMLRWP